ECGGESGGSGGAVASILKSNEEGAVGELGQETRRDGETKASLARAARPGQRHEAFLPKELDDRPQLSVAADQLCGRDGQIVRPGIDRAERVEVLLESCDVEL